MRTARAKGLTKKQAIRKHALRASLIPTSVNVAFSIREHLHGCRHDREDLRHPRHGRVLHQLHQ
ncbi:MAG: hypothetical protein LKE27_04735 [Atopobiaceae bacterium]|nr:hypothetical protein [Atopobiaceae bacterium]